jgi:hypothetical protein
MQATASGTSGCAAQLDELIKLHELDKLTLSDPDMRQGVQSMQAALKVLVPLAAAGSGKRTNLDGRVVAGGRTQVCPSAYIVRRIFFALAKLLAPPQCVAQQRELRQSQAVMQKLASDHTHRCARQVWHVLNLCAAAPRTCKPDPAEMPGVGTDAGGRECRSMRGLRGAHEERLDRGGRPMQVAFHALLLTITGADGSVLAAVVVPSEDHKWTLAAMVALFGIEASDPAVWSALPRAKEADVPCFRFIYDQVLLPPLCALACLSLSAGDQASVSGPVLQVSPGGPCCNVLPKVWASDNVGCDCHVHEALLKVLMPPLCARMLTGAPVVISVGDGEGNHRDLTPEDALVLEAAAGRPLARDDITAVGLVMVQDIYHARQRVLDAVDQHHPDFKEFEHALSQALWLVNPREQTLLAGNVPALQACRERLRGALKDMERRFESPVSKDRLNSVQKTHCGVAAVADMVRAGHFGEECADIVPECSDAEPPAGAAEAAVGAREGPGPAPAAASAAVAAALRAAPTARPLVARMTNNVTVSSKAVRWTAGRWHVCCRRVLRGTHLTL